MKYFFSITVKYNYVQILERKFMGFSYGKGLAAQLEVVKKGQKTVSGPKLPPAKIFSVQMLFVIYSFVRLK